MKIEKVKETHQVYGPSAVMVACGRGITNDMKTALPGKGVTCKVCNRVEATRRQEAKERNRR